jgi:hypothetical protein
MKASYLEGLGSRLHIFAKKIDVKSGITSRGLCTGADLILNAFYNIV